MKTRQGANEPDIDGFCLDAITEWVNHISSYLAASEKGTAIFFASYDELLQSPESVLVEMLNWLGVRSTPGVVSRAVANMQFGNLQALEARDSAAKPPVFRMGRAGSGAKELKPGTVAEIRRRADQLLARAGEIVARQKSVGMHRVNPVNNETSAKAPARNGHAAALEPVSGKPARMTSRT